MKQRLLVLALLMAVLSLHSCVKKVGDGAVTDSTITTHTSTITQPTADALASNNYPVTLPVLDAFLSDSSFANGAKSSVGISDSELVRVRMLARQASHDQDSVYSTSNDEYSGSTLDARQRAFFELKGALGEEKARKLIAYTQSSWRGDAPGSATASNDSSNTARNQVPTDTRIVVNAPAYRMDVFDSGKLIKSYKVAIGYPEFPLPTGLRKASEIIVNPTWTPPDEPWVEAGTSKVKVGEEVPAGDKRNPLGTMKIPIGGPSLIHGGKSTAQIGGFGSHGCVGLTEADAKDFEKLIAKISGTTLEDKDLAAYAKNRKESHDVKLSKQIPVELRYETMVVDSGKLHVYRDVYDHNTNNDQELEATLKTYGLSASSLTDAERTQVKTALEQMSRDVRTNTDSSATASKASAKDSSKAVTAKSGSSKQDSTVQLTKTVKGKKEIVIPIAALQGKGYPAPVMKSASVAATTKKK